MLKALNVEPNILRQEIPKGIRNKFLWLGKDKLKEKGFDMIFFSYSLRYNDNMKKLARHLKEIASEETYIEIIDYLENPYANKEYLIRERAYKRRYIKPLQDVGFKVVESFIGENNRVFYRLCTCSLKGMQYQR